MRVYSSNRIRRHFLQLDETTIDSIAGNNRTTSCQIISAKLKCSVKCDANNVNGKTNPRCVRSFEKFTRSARGRYFSSERRKLYRFHRHSHSTKFPKSLTKLGHVANWRAKYSEETRVRANSGVPRAVFRLPRSSYGAHLKHTSPPNWIFRRDRENKRIDRKMSTCR